MLLQQAPRPRSAAPRGGPEAPDRWLRSSRQLHLHAYDDVTRRRVGFVETKIGGHPLDHKRILESSGPGGNTHGAYRGSYKIAPRGIDDLLSLGARRHSPAYEARGRPVLEYSPVKIGGHALDHVPFVNRGRPSRPLWGFIEPLVVFGPRPPPQVPIPIPSPAVGTARVHWNLPNLYDCSRCCLLRETPRAQLCCGHALCASCLGAKTLEHHVILGEGSSTPDPTANCLLECRVCDDFVAIEAFVFSDERVFALGPPAVRSLRQWRRTPRPPPLGRRVHGGAVAVLVTAAAAAMGLRRVRRPLPVGPLPSSKTTESIHKTTDATVGDIVAMGANQDDHARWAKRLRGLSPPSKLLTYTFVRSLGVGNFAEVLLVRDRKGALAVLKESDRLPVAINEIRLLSEIRSPHVVRIREFFVEEIGHRPFAYIEMEYCERGDLGQWLPAHGALDAATFAGLFRQLCLGLEAIHAQGIVHRDLKPANILLTATNVAKIADFGVSTRLDSDLATHHAAGTVAFMAPEVRRFFLGEDVSYDTTADVWSLGALAVAMLTGNPEPRVTIRPVDEIVDELHERGLPERLVRVVQQTLDPDPRRRPTLSSLLDLCSSLSARL